MPSSVDLGKSIVLLYLVLFWIRLQRTTLKYCLYNYIHFVKQIYPSVSIVYRVSVTKAIIEKYLR